MSLVILKATLWGMQYVYPTEKQEIIVNVTMYLKSRLVLNLGSTTE